MLASQWFVVQTNPQKEAFVEQRLKMFHGVEPYAPRFKNLHGKVGFLFPRYIFVIAAIAEIRSITTTFGVRNLLMAGDHPALLPGSEIAKLKARERGGLIQLPPSPRFQIGERLTILRGSLRHRTVIYDGMSGKDRERVLINMLGGQVTLTVATEDLVSEYPKNRLHRARETSNAQRQHSRTARIACCA